MGQNHHYAFILAAGHGKRLRPYTDNMPKPLVPVHGQPIIGHTIDKLKRAGVKEIIVNLHYLGKKIKEFCENLKEPEFIFSEEKEILDTGGGIKKALGHVKEDSFYIINGDAFWTDGPDKSALECLSELWDSSKMDILLLLQSVDEMILTEGVGDYNLLPDGKAVRSKDKTGKYMFAGVRLSKKLIFENSPDEAFSYLELMDQAEKEGKLYGLIHDGEWHHISTPQDLENVNQALEKQNLKANATW